MVEFEEYEHSRMEKNTWTVAVELQRRLDDAPILDEHIKAFDPNRENDKGFFFSRNYLTNSMDASEQKRKDFPGQSYFKKVLEFYNSYYNTGKLFLNI